MIIIAIEGFVKKEMKMQWQDYRVHGCCIAAKSYQSLRCFDRYPLTKTIRDQ